MSRLVKDVMKIFFNKMVLICLAMPIFLNIVATISFLHGMAGGDYSEKYTGFVLYLANWPTMLLTIYPFDIRREGEVAYDIFGWFNFAITATNILGWGLLGLLCSFMIKKYRKNRSQKES